MDPTDFLPAHTEMLEERFGRIGRYIANVQLLTVSLFLILLPFGAIAGISTVVANLVNWQPIDFGGHLVGRIIFYVVVTIVMIVVYSFFYRRTARRSREARMLYKKSNKALDQALEAHRRAEGILEKNTRLRDSIVQMIDDD